jgi:hypothetical protein
MYHWQQIVADYTASFAYKCFFTSLEDGAVKIAQA